MPLPTPKLISSIFSYGKREKAMNLYAVYEIREKPFSFRI